jgi:photosystem II stability/assembly factor-like uncharacterized protein
MKIKLIIYLFLLITPIVTSQNRWLKLNGPEGGVISGLYSKGDTLIAGAGLNYGIIYYSTNKGLSWEQTPLKLSDRVVAFTASGDNGIMAGCKINGIYKSYDLKNWTRLSPTGDVISLGSDYQGNIYAGTVDGKIFGSTDNGSTWTVTSFQYAIENFTSISDYIFAGGYKGIYKKYIDYSWTYNSMLSSSNTLRIFSDHEDSLYCHTPNRVFSSTDYGLSWIEKDNNRFFAGEYVHGMVYNQRLIASCSDETDWFGVGWGAAVSDDKGWTWRWSQNGLPPLITGWGLIKSGADTYMGTNAAGVFKSTDYGDSWFPVNNGIHAANVIDINFDKDGTLYSAAWSSGLSKSNDFGKSWRMINNGLTNVYFYCILPDDDGILYSGSERGAFRSTDKGENWQKITRPGNGFVFNLKKDKKNRIYALTYGSGLYRTTDKGESWLRLDQNLFNRYFLAMAFDSLDNIYAGDGNRIFRSKDDGQSWTKVYEGAEYSVTGLAVSPKENIFAAVNSVGVVRSTDGGDTWELKSNGVSKYLSTLNINENGNIYATAMGSGGIWQSADEGESWSNITSNLPFNQVNRIIFKNNELYLATDESVWKSNPDSLTSAAEDDIKPKEYFLSQNYPNPFNPSTTIKYSLPQTGRVTLSIYDLLGREVVKLIDEEKPAGEYETKWNASSHPSGVYFMRMQAGEFSEVRKVVLVK